jgi:N-acylneuraminate cytidylyltransferase/lysophospholipase L1 and related esterases involved in polysaccharide synthesis
MLSDQDILNRYLAKRAEFEKTADITLIGHSLFDMWGDLPDGTPSLAGKSVANLGISGVSTRQYLDVVVRPGYIQHLGQTVFLFLGVNDIVKEPDYSPMQVMSWLEEILRRLQKVAPNSRYFLLEATPVNNIPTVDNPEIHQLNAYLQEHCPAGLTFVPTQSFFMNKEGKLDLELCTDGLHFNPRGYERLTQILLERL